MRDGSFILAGLRPGAYEITVAMPQYKPAASKLTVLVGQNIDLDFRLTADLVYTENVTVVGEQAIDVKTSQVATNITAEQIRNLPQNDRNFLNFAALAPGVRVNAGSETNKEVTAGALPGFNTNVFIDGVSYKNDILLGGVVGQDSSRGNPFPQNAVQEFRVLTQNFKAELEKASSAAITAVTKSGGNTWTGDVFLLYQDKSLVAQDTFAEERGEEKPTYERFQGGASVGGPLIRNKLTFFGSYELQAGGPRQERVLRRRDPASAAGPDELPRHVHEPVPLAPRLRQAVLAARPGPHARRQLQPARRGGGQGLRRPARAGERHQLHHRRGHR